MSESFESGVQRETVANPKLRELFTEAENGLYAFDPVADAEAHGPGSRFLDRVSNLHDPFPLDPEARAKLQNENNKLLNNLAVVNLDGLSPQEHTMFDMLQHDTVNRINLLRLSTAYRRPIDHTPASVPWALQNDASGEGRIHFETPLDLDCFYNQLQGFPEWTTKALRSMYKAIEEGETQPQIIMQRVQKQLEMLLSDEGTAQAAFSRPLDLVAGSEPWRKPYHEVITQSVLPAYKTLLRSPMSTCRIFVTTDTWAFAISQPVKCNTKTCCATIHLTSM